MDLISNGTRAELVEMSNECYIHQRITYRELLDWKVLHHLRAGDTAYAARLAHMLNGHRTVGDVLNDGDEEARMDLAAKLNQRAGENPLRPDTVRFEEVAT
jgi:hypothetical protein